MGTHSNDRIRQPITDLAASGRSPASPPPRPLAGVTLVEVLVALTILSTILLPMGLSMSRQFDRGAETANTSQVLGFLDNLLETALAVPFDQLPLGEASNTRILDREGRLLLDLSPHELGGELIECSLRVELVPVALSVVTDPATAETRQVHLDEGMKRLTVEARWGRQRLQRLELTAFKANL